VISRPGLGTFVAATIPAAIAHESYRSLRADLERCIGNARAQGLDEGTIASLFAHVLRENANEVVA
jgi:DNA-binding transcriptional regulator YhcF (GntR family)